MGKVSVSTVLRAESAAPSSCANVGAEYASRILVKRLIPEQSSVSGASKPADVASNWRKPYGVGSQPYRAQSLLPPSYVQYERKALVKSEGAAKVVRNTGAGRAFRNLT